MAPESLIETSEKDKKKSSSGEDEKVGSQSMGKPCIKGRMNLSQEACSRDGNGMKVQEKEELERK